VNGVATAPRRRRQGPLGSQDPDIEDVVLEITNVMYVLSPVTCLEYDSLSRYRHAFQVPTRPPTFGQLRQCLAANMRTSDGQSGQ